MKIAFIGIRGIPVIYGAFETFAENLAADLVKKDYDITIYCRSFYVNKSLKTYKDVRLITLPTLKSKHFETFIHSFLSTFHACLLKKYDVIYFWGVGNAIFALLPRLLGIKTVINIDGLDWKREKWGYFAKKYLKFSEYLATKFADIVISDSLYIKSYYLKNYKKETVFIPYCFHEDRRNINNESLLLKKYGLTKQKYFIWTGRIIPDNHLEDLILAFRNIKTDFKCLIVGDDFYNHNYKQYIYDLAKEDKKIVFTGYIDRKSVYALERNCFAYIETKRSGSTHQSLVEALGLGCFIIANDYEVNKQILKTSAVFYKQDKKDKDLKNILKNIIKPVNVNKANDFKKASKKVYKKYFSEEQIVGQYESLFRQIKSI